MTKLQVPSKIREMIDKKTYIVDDVGMSGNQVLIFEDMVLKIEDNSVSVGKQVQLMKWMEGKIPVPHVLEYEEENGKCYLLMSRMGGVMSCDNYYLEHPEILFEPVFSHGDYCLPNVFLEDVQVKGFNPDMLFDALGIEPNWDKINYYILLDELF